ASWEVRVIEGRRDVDLDTAEGIDDVAERLEVDPDPVVDRLPRYLRDRRRRQVATAGVGLQVAADVRVTHVIDADRVGAVDLAHHEAVGGQRGDLHPQVPRQRDHDRLPTRWSNREQHDGVGQ